MKARIDEDNLLVSKSVVKASERLLKRVDDAVAADPKLTAKVEAIMLEAQIALKLEEAQKSCGLSQRELAARIGTSQPQIARLERRSYASSPRTLAEFGAAYGRKQMGKQPENAHKQWTPAQKTELRKLAKENTPTRVIGIKLERTPSAVQAEASKLDVSLKPTNQRPYNRKPGK